MPVHIYTDASVKNKEARGAYIITKNNQTKGFKSSANYENIKLYRTSIMEVKKNSNITGIDDMELRTIVQGLLHAFRLHKDQIYFTVYSDSMNSIDKIKLPWYDQLEKGLHPMVEHIYSYMNKDPRNIKIRVVHVKSHKNSLGSTPEKLNFVCDIMASVANKI